MNEVKNKLCAKDRILFERMNGNFISNEEKIFFDKMKYKMECEIAPSNDLIMFELDNQDHIYIVRRVYDEFIIGHGTEENYDEEFHTMNLSEALYANLKELGFIIKNLTLLEWLRECNYKGIRYNHNYTFL